MSMKTVGVSAWEIPLEKLEEVFPAIVAFIQENEDDFLEWLQDDTGDYDGEHCEAFETIGGEIAAWGNSQGLTLNLGYRMADEEDGLSSWMVECDNAITINPAFAKVGGELIHWTATC